MSDILRETRMANPEHEAVVRQGAKSLSLWRMSHPQVKLNLKEADLSGLDLYKIRLRKADLRDANLFRTNLSCADLSEADLSGANLCDADLMCTNLSGAKLTGADFSNANLIETDFSWADLSDGNLENAILKNINLNHAIGVDLSTITVDAVAENKTEPPVLRQKKLYTGYVITFSSIFVSLFLLGIGLFISAIAGLYGVKVLHQNYIVECFMGLALLTLSSGMTAGAIAIASSKGYFRIIGFILVGLPLAGLWLDFLLRLMFEQKVITTLNGPVLFPGFREMFKRFILMNDVYYLSAAALAGIFILGLLPPRKKISSD
ncbi:pentapeptide repeat-containing protein [Gimesia maris]|uniref:pentapeptide repeat-containing protein n=1 Tax=Gimesia maris TaxID=122 RepID=UPI0018D9D7BD|nr:pentapeptide repeat-containing protein [Gimesia maris]